MLSILSKRQYDHLNSIELSKSALLKNHEALQQLQPDSVICPILKSNAYGHGLKALAPLFDSFKVPYLIVDSLYEAYELYKCHIRTPILILGYTHPDNFKIKKIPFHITLFDVQTAKALSAYQPNCPVHIFVDTGMHREGILLEELPSFLKEIQSLRLNIVGLASHFSDADNSSTQKYTFGQIKNYKEALKILNGYKISPRWRHISASGGSLKMKDTAFNMVRAGIASYGISPLRESDVDNRKLHLHPALTLKTHIIQVKDIPKDSYVGYNGTYKTQTKKR